MVVLLCMLKWKMQMEEIYNYVYAISVEHSSGGQMEKKLETYSEGSHSAYRVYMSAEPAPTPDSHIIPQVCPHMYS